jgi:hypothetical protein
MVIVLFRLINSHEKAGPAAKYDAFDILFHPWLLFILIPISYGKRTRKTHYLFQV